MMTGQIAGAGKIIAVDLAKSRLRHALDFGATLTVEGGADEDIFAIAPGGVDVAIEAVGIPQTFGLRTRVMRAGGSVANIGVHGAPTTLHPR